MCDTGKFVARKVSHRRPLRQTFCVFLKNFMRASQLEKK